MHFCMHFQAPILKICMHFPTVLLHVSRRAESLLDLIAEKAPGVARDVIAVRAGIAPRTLANLCAGEVERPHRGSVALLAKALKVSATRVSDAIAESFRRASE